MFVPYLEILNTLTKQTEKIKLLRAITHISNDPSAHIHVLDTSFSAHIIKEKINEYTIVSTNPVLINGKKYEQKKLIEGDQLKIGHTLVIFKYEQKKEEPLNTQKEKTTHVPDMYTHLYAFSERLLKNYDIEEMLPVALDTAVQLSHADNGYLVIFKAGKPHIEIAQKINKNSFTDTQGELSDAVITRVIKEQAPLLIKDALHDTEFSASQSIMSLQLSSVLCVPLMDHGQLFGLIYLGAHHPLHQFTQESLHVVTILGMQTALLIQNATRFHALKEEQETLKKALLHKKFGNLIGSHETMQSIFNTIKKVAPTEVSVLITGETGTGKELIAREIHERSDRNQGPFVVINCGAIPENLLESELFGHVRGAFTGATQNKMGKFQLAHQGTLFLDEIGELPLNLQVKLLRVLQEKIVTRLGDNKQESIDIRVLAATNRNLEEEIKTKQFREDLYYRLHVIHIHLPPLRERGHDLITLARHFLKQYTSEFNSNVKDFSAQATVAIQKYAWPGNIRQLENRIKKAVLMTDKSLLSSQDLDLKSDEETPVLSLAEATEKFKNDYIKKILQKNNGNKTKTAQDLNVDPRTIFRHLEE